MTTSPFRRLRVSSRAFGLLLTLLFSSGQAALIAHHHELRSRSARVAVSADDHAGGEADCRVCALSVQARASHAASAAQSVRAPELAEAVFAAPSAVAGRIAGPRASSRAPPSA